MKNIEQIVIVGSGPAGLTAALYTARAGKKPLVLDGMLPGGQLTHTAYVENWPGQEHILGPELIMKLRNHAASFGTRYIADTVTHVDLTQHPFIIETKNKQTIHANSIIIATGRAPRRLNCPGEEEYWGKGVSTCAVCDGALYRDQSVVIAGGGDTAIEHALFLAQFTNKITIIHQLPHLTASKAMQQRLAQHPEITVVFEHTISRITGNDTRLNNVHAINKKTKHEMIVPAHAVFLGIGSQPNTALFAGELAMDAHGSITVTGCTTHTSIPGVFACGDVIDNRYRQAITAAGYGCMAALDAISFLNGTL